MPPANSVQSDQQPSHSRVNQHSLNASISSRSSTGRFLVCGLGSLGQFCVSVLKEFKVPVSAITLTRPLSWEIPNLPDLVDDLLIGDCRQPDLLEKAGIQDCRAVLLVASDERANIEAAFAVRLLNPIARIIVRSAKENLNELVGDRLGNFVAFEATQLPAPAFAIAALSSEIRGFITLDDYTLRVVKASITKDHRWCDRRLLHELNTQTRRILSHIPYGSPLPTEFYQWNPDAKVQAGDLIAYIELTETFSSPTVQASSTLASAKKVKGRRSFGNRIHQVVSTQYWKQRLATFWRSTGQQQSKRVAVLVGTAILTLLILGTVTLKLAQPEASIFHTFYVAGVMLLGSYDVVYAALSPQDAMPLWMRLMNLGYMLAGTASIAVLYALLTETLLAAKFQLPKKRPPAPDEDHVVLVGLGRVGRRVAAFLQQLKQPVVGVSNAALEPTVLPQLPVVVGDLAGSLARVNLTTAKSVVVATDDEMANLEIGLMAHRVNPNSALVIRTFDPRFSASVARLLPYAKVLCAYDLAAEAFVAAAFGENILNLLRLNEQTVLTTEYFVEANDTLNGRLLGEVSYGYGVVPILHDRADKPMRLMPSDDTRLEVGDRLVVLAPIESLQRVERGELLPKTYRVQIERALSSDSVFDGANAIARVSDCGIQFARDVMNQLPAQFPHPLYQHQAQRLVRELAKAQVSACLVVSGSE
ncbi:MAG: NAD-binding protein [Oscillatoriales cyanobacterium C42_A2020_001]|nr:NAD-binding protein [Leptolyngbyaceae cyanobacterium C42_A2020_001]